MKVFIYSERQKELAGKDGLEQFSAVFKEKSRVCVILFRHGWGKTKWTRIEETAIKDRIFEKGWDFLLVIALESSKIPPWLPKTKIWLGFERFGIQGAASIIDARVQENGGEVHEESPSEKASRLSRHAKLREKHENFLNSKDGVKLAREVLTSLFSYLEDEIEKIKSLPEYPPIAFHLRDKDVCLVRAPFASFTMGWFQQFENSLKYSSLFIREFDGAYSFYGPEKNTPASKELTYYFSLDDAGLPIWVEKEVKDHRYSFKDLANHFLNYVLEKYYNKE